jgi:imidazolonepropionase-like amidohydrolase
VDDMVVKEKAAMKIAFGENPKRCYKDKGVYSRMSVAAKLREHLTKAIIYDEKRKLAGWPDQVDYAKMPAYDPKIEALIPVIRGEIPLKAHAHRADDILTAIRIAKEFGVKLTLDHCTDGAIIADELAKEGYPAFVGPSLGSKSKVELSNKSFATAKVLHEAGVPVSIITDAPVIPLQYLPMCAGLAVDGGLDPEEAWKSITIRPATALGIADRVGSLEPGKDADIVIWTADPITALGAAARMTIVDGKIVYEKQ